MLTCLVRNITSSETDAVSTGASMDHEERAASSRTDTLARDEDSRQPRVQDTTLPPASSSERTFDPHSYEVNVAEDVSEPGPGPGLQPAATLNIDKLSRTNEGSGAEAESPEAGEVTRTESSPAYLEGEMFMVDGDSSVEEGEVEAGAGGEEEVEVTTLSPDTGAELEAANSTASTRACLARLERHQLCDSLADCAEAADEAGCVFGGCREDEFPCLSGRCVPASWRCDGRPDCGPSAEDEVSCLPREAECPPGQFLCATEARCIPGAQLCDGRADCGRGEDEAEAVCACAEGEVRCQLGGGCVASSARCDGRHQCADRSDEWDCLALDTGTLALRHQSQVVSTV